MRPFSRRVNEAGRSGRPGFLSDRRGVAAVEFALILPVMMLLYLGSVTLTKGMMASRKVTLVARALSDLAAQQSTCVTNGALKQCLTPTELSSILDAGAIVMSPFTTTTGNFRLTLSQVDIVQVGTSFYAYTNWSTVRGTSAIYRPCSGDGALVTAYKATNKSLLAQTVKASVSGYQGKFPADYTDATTATVGSIIVSDVFYDYQPVISFSLFNYSQSTNSTISFSDIATYRTRASGASISLVNASGTQLPTGVASNVTVCP